MNIKKHRLDIDGLRSIASLPVLFFHAVIKIFQDGFIGVAIFFVINGFLTTNLLMEDIAKTGRMNLISFYERRVRKIAPILLGVVLFIVFVGTALQILSSYLARVQHILGLPLFLSKNNGTLS